MAGKQEENPMRTAAQTARVLAGYLASVNPDMAVSLPSKGPDTSFIGFWPPDACRDKTPPVKATIQDLTKWLDALAQYLENASRAT